MLTASFGDTNRKRNARMEYRSLRQGTRDFNTFWAQFQRLAAELDHSEETLIDDLIEKCHHSIQRHLVDGEEDPTNLLQLAKRCQRIEQRLKKVDWSQLVQDRIAERSATRRNNGSNRQPIVNAPAAAPAPANSNSTSTRMAQIFQPCAQLAAPPVRATNPTTNSATPRLTPKETDQLMKFGRCFNCKGEGHVARGCTRPAWPYSAVSAKLQEVTVVEEDLGKE